MIFNPWRKYPKRKPKEPGWYLCTCAHGNGLDQANVMDIYYDKIHETWIDYRRQHVFNGYKVYESGKPPLDDFRVHTDSDCERIDVVAWKYLPDCYRKGLNKHE